MKSLDVLETCLYVDDLDAAESFYAEVLGLRVVSQQPGRHVFFRCGSSMLLLFEPNASSREPSDVPTHGAHGPGHVAFAVASDELDDWLSRLDDRNVTVEQHVDWPNGGRSIYIRDPAGNSVELATRNLWGISDETLGSA